ncbi:MAG: nitrous oxide reductase accessory protein NosL [Aquificaceae bacterium]|nr:nitrous oxide reductase accessory protein NosL [Aquificaceae bacterium]
MKQLILLMIFPLLVLSQPKEPSKGERCVVCGMDVNMEPRLTSSQVKLKDGSYRYAESPKHIIQFYLENKEKVAEVWVKDYRSGKWIDGKKAFYIHTSSGPMGHDLIPFQSRIEAQKEAGKGKVYRLTDMDKSLLQRLEKGHIH